MKDKQQECSDRLKNIVNDELYKAEIQSEYEVNKDEQMYSLSEAYKQMESKWEKIWGEEQTLFTKQMEQENDRLLKDQLNEKQYNDSKLETFMIKELKETKFKIEE